MDSKTNIISEIIKGITEFKIIPFIGAGMSIKCGAKSWKEIIEELKKDVDTNEEDYLLIAQLYENKYGRNNLIERLRTFCQLEYLTSENLEIHQRILCMNPPIIYTTNFDNAIEESASLLHRDYKKIVTLKDIIDCPHGTKQIIKFHGDFSNADSIVFTRKDYDSRLNLERHPLNVLFRANMLGKSIFFLGYSFNDENIQLVFDMHKKYYGANNLPKSYIIAFEENQQREKDLAEMNVVTLHLSSPDELSGLINDISNKVFDNSTQHQFNLLLQPIPTIVLTKFEISSLKSFVNTSDYTTDQKYNKIRETLESKELSSDVEEYLCAFIVDIIDGDYHEKVKEAIVVAFQHINIRLTKNVYCLSIELMRLTENPNFIMGLDMTSWTMDVLMAIEHRISSAYRDPLIVKKMICTVIFSYMEFKKRENSKFASRQLERLLEALKSYRYKELGDLSSGFNQSYNESLIEYHLSQAETSVRTRYNTKSILSPQNAIDIMEHMLKNIPKNITDDFHL